MPRVPTYDSFQVGVDAGQSARVQAPEMQDFTGKQVQAAGDAMVKAGAAGLMVDSYIAGAQAKEADNQLTSAVLQAMHNDKSGFLSLTGKNAVDQREAYVAQLNTMADKIGESIQSQSGREQFELMKQQRMAAAMAQIDQHTATQAKAYSIGESSASIPNNLNFAVANYANPELVVQGYQQAKTNVEQLAELQGWSPEEKAMKMRAFDTSYVGSMVQKMVADGKTDMARQFLDTHIGVIEQDKVDNLRNLVKTAGVKDESLKLSLGMPAGNLQGNVKTADEMYKRGEITADVHDALIQRIHANYSTAKMGEADYEKSILGKAQDWVLKNQGKSVMDMPPDLYNALKSKGHLDSISSFAKSGGNPTTNMAVYGDLYQRIIDDPSSVTQADILAKSGSLSPSDQKILIDRLGTMTTKDAKQMQTVKLVDDAVKYGMTELKSVLGDSKGKINPDKLAEFKGALAQYIDVNKDSTKMTPDELNHLAMRFIQQGTITGSGFFFDDKKRFYQLSGDEAEHFTIEYDQIPRAEVERVAQAIKARGGDPSKENIAKLYNTAFKKGIK